MIILIVLYILLIPNLMYLHLQSISSFVIEVKIDSNDKTSFKLSIRIQFQGCYALIPCLLCLNYLLESPSANEALSFFFNVVVTNHFTIKEKYSMYQRKLYGSINIADILSC